MKTVKRIAEVLTVAVLAAVICLGVFGASARSDDPADSYVKMTAPNEDTSLSLWFDYSFHKTFTSDKKSTGKDTFSIYMAKNEIESAQFVLYSETDKTGMQAEITEFTDGKGNSIPADIYYEMYVTTSDVNTQTVWGTNRIIREGETPDPVIDLKRLGTAKIPPAFKLNGGKSQAFLIRAKSAEDTPAGWYSAQLDIKNASGQIVKTATVYCHVWDFEISEETRFQTAFFLANQFPYGGSYQEAYDYLLENRLNAMDMPAVNGHAETRSDNPYLTNPRVTAVRVTSSGCGAANKSYMEYNPGAYPGIYNELSSSPDWESFKDKLYFYSVDEPLPYPLVAATRQTVDDVKSYYNGTQFSWGEDIRFLVTPCEDFPYSARDKYYTKPMTQYKQEEIKDADQEMIETNTVQLFCPRVYAFTPYSELQNYFKNMNRKLSRENIDCLRGESIEQYSGCYGTCTYDDGGNLIGIGAVGDYDWDAVYGATYDRYMSHIINENQKGAYGADYEMWMYSAGCNKSYTYANHVIENTGLQTKLLFWQAYQNDVGGYLYYGTNNWNEMGGGTVQLDRTVTGDRTRCTWPLNKYTINAGGVPKYIYGNGVLFYGKSNAGVLSNGIVGSLRVEILRDSVEEYQMLSMLGDLKGKDRAKEIVSEVSTNVARYLSLSGFDRSAWSAGMSDDDIMESVRRQLGNELEAAIAEGECAHSWNEGEITKAAGCKTMGTMLYTCTKCSAERSEYIPTLHEAGECYRVVSETATTCTTDGSKVLECTKCGFRKTLTELSYHADNINHRRYEIKDASGHSEMCDMCGTVISSKTAHMLFNKTVAPTCTEDGMKGKVCKMCGYTEDAETIPASGHSFEDGKCTVCGEAAPDVPTFTRGDIDGDSKIGPKDVNILKLMITGVRTKVPAADVNADGKVSVSDVSRLKKMVTG